MEYLKPQQAKKFEEQCFLFFKDRQLHLVDKPAKNQNRQCTDPCCMLVFAGMFIFFVVYAIYSIDLMFSKKLNQLSPSDGVSFLKQVTQEQFYRVGVVLAACIGASVVISLVVSILLKLAPQIMVFGMSFLTIIFFAAVSLIDIIEINSGIATYFIVILLAYSGFVYKCWDHLKKAAILIKTVIMFIMENLKILLVLFFALLYCLLVLFFWVLGFYSFCTLYSHNELSYGGFFVSLLFWIVMLVFFNFYFYYTSVFLTSTSLAIWFYDKTDVFDTVVTPFKLMVRYHLGTITYASIMIVFSKIMKLVMFIAKENESQNKVLSLIGSFFTCIVSCDGSLQAMIEVVNNYSVIMCGLTGHGLMDSSKLVGQFVFNDSNKVFNDFTISTYFVSFGGILLITIIPTFIGGLLLLEISEFLWSFSVMLIFFLTSMIGLLVLQIFVESISTLFLLYSLDGRLAQDGLEVVWVQKFVTQLQKGFDEAFVGKLQKKKIKTKTVTTVVIHVNGAVEHFERQVIDDEIERNGYQKVNNTTSLNITLNTEQNLGSNQKIVPY